MESPTQPHRPSLTTILLLILVPLAIVLVALGIAVAAVSIVHLYNVANELREDIRELERTVDELEAYMEIYVYR